MIDESFTSGWADQACGLFQRHRIMQKATLISVTCICCLIHAHENRVALSNAFSVLTDDAFNSKESLAADTAFSSDDSNLTEATESLLGSEKLVRLIFEDAMNGEQNFIIEMDARDARKGDNLTTIASENGRTRNMTLAELGETVVKQSPTERAGNITFSFKHTQRMYQDLLKQLSEEVSKGSQQHNKRTHANISSFALQPWSLGSRSSPVCLGVISVNRALWLLLVFGCVVASATPIAYLHQMAGAQDVLTVIAVVSSVVGILGIIMPFVSTWANKNASSTAPGAMALYILNSTFLNSLLRLLGQIAMIKRDTWPDAPIRADDIGILLRHEIELLPPPTQREDSALPAFSVPTERRSLPLEILIHREYIDTPERHDSAPL